MGYGWENASKRIKEVKNKYLTLKNTGDAVVVAFCGTPFEKPPVGYNSATNKYEPYNPKHHDDPVYKYKYNVFNKELGMMQTWDIGITTLGKIEAQHKKGGLDKYFFEITKEEGNGRFAVGRDDEITPAMREKIDSCGLNELDPDRRDAAATPEEQPPAKDDDVPF